MISQLTMLATESSRVYAIFASGARLGNTDSHSWRRVGVSATTALTGTNVMVRWCIAAAGRGGPLLLLPNPLLLKLHLLLLLLLLLLLKYEALLILLILKPPLRPCVLLLLGDEVPLARSRSLFPVSQSQLRGCCCCCCCCSAILTCWWWLVPRQAASSTCTTGRRPKSLRGSGFYQNSLIVGWVRRWV